MTEENEQVKKDLQRKILMSASTFMDPETLRKLETILDIQLHDVTVHRVETAISTEFAISNEEYIKRFLAVKTLKGLSDRTVAYYSGVLKCALQEMGKPVPAIKAGDIRYYLAVKKTRDHNSNVSLDNILRVLRSFFDTMVKEELIASSPTDKVDSVKFGDNEREPLTEEEVERIRRACSTDTLEGLRDLALVETLASTGCRISEVAGMDRSKIKDGAIKVLGKGSKTRTVWFNARAKIAIDEYLKARKDDNQALFVGLKKPWDRLSTGVMEKIIRELGKAAGVENCFPHRFRHTFATTALRRGVPIDQVGAMLGHAKLTTTQIYAKTDAEQVREVHRKYMG